MMIKSLELLKKSESSCDRRPIYNLLFCRNRSDVSENVIRTFLSHNSGWLVPLITDALDAIAKTDGHEFYFDVLEFIFTKLEVLPSEEDVGLNSIEILTNKAEEILNRNDPITSELVMKYWSFVVTSVRRKFNDVPVVNSVCVVFKHGFKSKDNTVVALTYSAWRTLIAVFACDPDWSNPNNGIAKKKLMSGHLVLITKPLFYSKVICLEAVADAVFETWWILAKSVGERLPFLFEEILIPHLLFCLGANVQGISSSDTNGKVICALKHPISDSNSLVTLCRADDFTCKANFKMLPKLGLKALALLENILRDNGEFKCTFANSFSISTYGIFIADCLRQIAYNTALYGMIERSAIFNALPKLWCFLLKKLGSLDSSLLPSRLEFYGCQLEHFCLNDSANVELSKDCLRAISNEFNDVTFKKIAEPIVKDIEEKLQTKFGLNENAKKLLLSKKSVIETMGETSGMQISSVSSSATTINGFEDSEDSDIDRVETITSSSRGALTSSAQSNSGNNNLKNIKERNEPTLENSELDKSSKKELPKRNRRAPVIFGAGVPNSSNRKATREKGQKRSAKNTANKNLSRNVLLENVNDRSAEVVDLDLTTTLVDGSMGMLAEIYTHNDDTLSAEKFFTEKTKEVSNASSVANKENAPVISEMVKLADEIRKDKQKTVEEELEGIPCSIAGDVLNKKSLQRRGTPLNVQDDDREWVKAVEDNEKTSLLRQSSKNIDPILVPSVLPPKKGGESSTSKIPISKIVVRRVGNTFSQSATTSCAVTKKDVMTNIEPTSKNAISVTDTSELVVSNNNGEVDASNVVNELDEASGAMRNAQNVAAVSDSVILLGVTQNTTASSMGADGTALRDSALKDLVPTSFSFANADESSNLTQSAIMATSSAPSTPVVQRATVTALRTPPASILRKPNSPAVLSSRRVHFDVETSGVEGIDQVTSTTPKVRNYWADTYGSSSSRKRRSLLTKYSPRHYSTAGNTEYPLIPLSSLDRSLVASTSEQASGLDPPSKKHPLASESISERTEFSSFAVVGEPPAKRLNTSPSSTTGVLNEMNVDGDNSVVTGAGDRSVLDEGDRETSMVVSENDWFMPDYAYLNEPISLKMCQQLAPATGNHTLQEQLRRKGISTVGMFARLSEKEVSQLQIRAQPTKVLKAKTTLSLYASTPKNLAANRSLMSNTTADSYAFSVEANFSFSEAGKTAVAEKVVRDSAAHHASNTFTLAASNNTQHDARVGKASNLLSESRREFDNFIVETITTDESVLPSPPEISTDLVTANGEENVASVSNDDHSHTALAESVVQESGEESSLTSTFRQKYRDMMNVLCAIKSDELPPEFGAMAFSMIKKLSVLGENRMM